MSYQQLLNQLENELEPLKFECYPFKVGWYNECVDKRFELNYPPNTFAVLVINTPSMFETLFIKHMFENYKNNLNKLDALNDPIDTCLNDLFEKVKFKLENDLNGLDDISIEAIKDYDIDPGTRRAKIVMQTCAHISGAAYFYDPKKYTNELTMPNKDQHIPVKKNFMGVCLHSKYGGWFAMRCVFIFKNLILEDSQLSQNFVEDPLNGNVDSIVDLIKKFNYNWKDSTYRDVIRVEEKYSEMQKEYFLSDPKLRKDLLKEWLSYPNIQKLYESYYIKKNQAYLEKNFYII